MPENQRPSPNPKLLSKIEMERHHRNRVTDSLHSEVQRSEVDVRRAGTRRSEKVEHRLPPVPNHFPPVESSRDLRSRVDDRWVLGPTRQETVKVEVFERVQELVQNVVNTIERRLVLRRRHAYTLHDLGARG
jgi:hypothetical protein